MVAPLTPLAVDCPVCGEPIPLPAQIALNEQAVAVIAVSLDKAREHAREHGEIPADAAQFDAPHSTVLPAALAKFGAAW